MIQCPECTKEIADDAAHCGHCGAKIQSDAGMKTMFGFGALTPEMMQQAAKEVEAAKELKAAQKDAAHVASNVIETAKAPLPPMAVGPDTFDTQKTLPTPAIKVPNPTFSGAPNPGMQESSSVFDLPVPGSEKKLEPFAPRVDLADPTVQPGSVGATPQGSADPAWAAPPVQNAPVQNAPAQNAPAQNAPAQNAPAQNAPAQMQNSTPAMPQSVPQHTDLSAESDPKLDWGGSGGPIQEKSKMPLYIAGGCFAFVILGSIGFGIVSFLLSFL